ncbi:DUF4142 domain-containing protein [Muricoccus pecuniae]|uniref:Putative outer membrane protein n=1 Tax=Muricoccus pecuniae TaxID=693023 RepID=A0A840YCG9_9PROT|nr:DUF4142 domain-containing protein [Roseomonas pecuniae]MBB5696379.1 putative outer membrane protein [Roseomonas pecuniae]
MTGFLPALLLGRLAAAQDRGPEPFDPARFLGFAASSAEFQRRAATLAAERDTRPEVKAFAAEMMRYREGQLKRLETLRGAVAPALQAEHQVVFENLEPLDYLALSRRYMEVQMQALEQEERGYEAATRLAPPELRSAAAAMLPEILRLQQDAQRALEAVRP